MKKNLLITMFVSIIIATIVYIAGLQSKDDNEISAQNLNTSADVQIYHNPDAGYSFECPKEWQYDNSSNGNPAMFVDPVAMQQEAETELMQGSKIEIYFEKVSEGKTLEELVNEKNKLFPPDTQVDTIVDDLPAIRTTSRDAFGTFTNSVFLIIDEKFIWITQLIPVDSEVDQDTKDFESVIATFKQR